jgi:hypothetical protein
MDGFRCLVSPNLSRETFPPESHSPVMTPTSPPHSRAAMTCAPLASLCVFLLLRVLAAPHAIAVLNKRDIVTQ